MRFRVSQCENNSTEIMNHARKITLEEKKVIQLEMLKEFDSFCRKNEIKYSLAFGTLLGAIRHKGFIPWDDDVDIMMPLPDMLRFKELFHSETIKYCDVDTELFFEYPFSRITNTLTYKQKGVIVQSYGVCIDLYPMVSIPMNQKEKDCFFDRALILEKRSDFIRKWRTRAIKYLPLYSIPCYGYFIKHYTYYLRNSYDYGSTGMYYIIAGPIILHDLMTYDCDLFEDIIDVEFEGFRFEAIANYDKFLALRYGDYMTPPPESQRHPYHGGNYYWKL